MKTVGKSDLSRKWTLLICLAVLPAITIQAETNFDKDTAEPVKIEIIRDHFKDPPPRYRPMVRWWWPGGDVTDAELQREIGLLNEAGFGGVEIQPFSMGLGYDVAPTVNDYLTPSFWARVRTALEEVKERDMWLDLTFGSGWPFGGAHIPLELATEELQFTHQTIQGPSTFNGQLPLPEFLKTHEPDDLDETLGWIRPGEKEREAMRDSQEIVAVVAMKGTGASAEKQGDPPRFGQQRYTVDTSGLLDPQSAIVLTDRVTEDGWLNWDVPEGQWQVFLFARNPADKTILAGVGRHPQRVLDHLDRSAMEAHQNAIGESAKRHLGEYFGNGLRAIFCDSLEVETNLFWTDEFLEEFQKRRGYNLGPLLPFVKQPGRGENYTTYQSLPFYTDSQGLSEGVRNDYWLTVSELLIENFYQPFADWAHRNNLLARIQAHGAQADIMAIYGIADIPETETLFHDGTPDFLHFASSVANQQGRQLAAAECFVHPGNPFATTPDSMKKEADQLMVAGINQLVYHGFPYEYTTSKGEPWHPFVAPLPFTTSINDRNTFWRFLPDFNAYVARTQLLSQSGRSVVPVALFDTDLSGEDSKRLGTEERREAIREQLIQRGMACDRLGSADLQRTRSVDGHLVTAGGMTYQALVVLGRDRIRISEAEAIRSFADHEVPVIFVNEIPDTEAGYLKNVERSQTIRRILDGMPLVQETGAAASWIGQRVSHNLIFSSPTPDFSFLEKRIGDVRIFFLRNESLERRLIELEIHGGGSPEIWDAWTGETHSVLTFDSCEKRVQLSLDFEPMQMRVLVLDPEQTHQSAPVKRTLETMEVDGLWTLTVGDTTRKLNSLFDWSQDVELKGFSGTATYGTVFELTKDQLSDSSEIWLRLSRVGDVAEVRLNGVDLPPLLYSPFKIEVRDWIQPGANQLEIRITNGQTNAELARGADLDGRFNNPANRMTQPAGLMGPVRLEFVVMRSR